MSRTICVKFRTRQEFRGEILAKTVDIPWPGKRKEVARKSQLYLLLGTAGNITSYLVQLVRLFLTCTIGEFSFYLVQLVNCLLYLVQLVHLLFTW